MEIKLEDRNYELKANGKFIKKYQELFKSNAVIDIYKASQTRDVLIMEQLTYCAIDESMPFDEWLDSFDTPFFVLNEFEKIAEYLMRGTTPTVDPKGNASNSESSKKKMNH